MRKRIVLVVMGCLLCAAIAQAAPEQAKPWKAGAEAGMLLTRGNTDTDSVNAKMSVENDRERWRHLFNAAYLSASDHGMATAEKTSALFKSDYKVSARDYFFAVLRGENDRFSGYTLQSTESAGYGRRLIVRPRVTLEMEVGAGGRQTHYVDDTRKNEAIARVALKAGWLFAEGNEFREEAFSEMSKDNKHTESVTSLKSKVNGNFSMKVSVTVIDNSEVPEGIKHTDTTTALALVFDY